MQMISQPKKILFLHTGSFCYDSATHFEQCISAELEKLGWQAEHCPCPDQNAEAALQPYYGQSFDIIFDINSILPGLQDDKGEFCLNRILGQKWHYILDHPLYHHDVLQCPLEDFNVICLDERHADFIRKYYRHIGKVLCLPLAAVQSDHLIPYPERQYEVLFTGTYTISDLMIYKTANQPAQKRKLFEQVSQLLLDEPELTLEEAMANFVDSEKIPLALQDNFLIDMYLRACIREELLAQLLRREISITVYGHNWNKFMDKCKDSIPNVENHLHIMGEIPYEKLPGIYADSKIALNQLPWFKAGMHDRIPLALMNGCVCVTDSSSFLDKYFRNGRELYYYSLENMEEAADIIQKLLQQPGSASKTAATGYSYAVQHLTWKNWAEYFLKAAV